MANFEEIRKEVAIKHNMVLDESDPVLLTVTMSEEILKRCVDRIIAQNREDNEAHQKAILNALQLGNTEAKQTAGKVITEAGDYVREQVNRAVSSAMEEGAVQFMELRAKTQGSERIAFIAMVVSVACAVVSLCVLTKVFFT
jgi:4-hydroxy-L-threonine phosphate dehydrogenase PdxA